MILRVILEQKVQGYWDYGPKDTFDWEIEPSFHPNPGYSRIGSFEANHWFTVKTGKSEKQTLANAKRHLRKTCRFPIKSMEYIEN